MPVLAKPSSGLGAQSHFVQQSQLKLFDWSFEPSCDSFGGHIEFQRGPGDRQTIYSIG